MRCLLVTLAICVVALFEVAHFVRGESCGHNERWTASRCDDLYCDADDLTTRDRNCNFDREWENCWCKEGYRRNQNYECVKESKCNNTCPENERPIRRGVKICEYMCSNPDGLCKAIKFRSGCACSPGFYRDIRKGCVKRSECSLPAEEPIEPME